MDLASVANLAKGIDTGLILLQQQAALLVEEAERIVASSVPSSSPRPNREGNRNNRGSFSGAVGRPPRAR